MSEMSPADMTLGEVASLAEAIRAEIAKAVVGQAETVDHLLVALLAQGHVLMEGPPGTAKTFLAQCLAASIGRAFGRIQFTPDLMPGDILGSNLFNFQTSQFTLTRGPIFTELLLADDQPHPAQDPGRPARSHAGTPGDAGWRRPCPRPRLHGGGNPEPDREPGRLSPARSPA
jgi:hypothetical protein